MSNNPINAKRPRWVLLGALIILTTAVVGLAALPRFKQQWSAPLGPALELPTYTPTRPEPTATEAQVTEAAISVGSASPTITESAQTLTPTTAPTATTRPTATPKPLCGGPPIMMVLGVGVDTKDNNYTYGLGDAIRVARVDFVTPKVSVLSIPRDIWVEIPGISDHYNLTHGKLNQSYLYGSPGMGYYDEPGGGAGLMARTLDLNFGLRADHYGAVNMLTFSRIVDAVGGIDLYLPYDVDGTPIDQRTADMGYFYAGNNHFTGDEALRFSRIRKRYNDLTRMDHQTMVICALRDKLLTPEVLPKIPKIIAAFKDSVITDLSLEQMSQLACLLPKLDSENLLFTSFPEEIFSPSRVYSPQLKNNTFVMEFDEGVLRGYIEQFIAGEWPLPSEDKGTTCP
jgi:LCP family protein required for cell wall assembly